MLLREIFVLNLRLIGIIYFVTGVENQIIHSYTFRMRLLNKGHSLISVSLVGVFYLKLLYHMEVDEINQLEMSWQDFSKQINWYQLLLQIINGAAEHLRDNAIEGSVKVEGLLVHENS